MPRRSSGPSRPTARPAARPVSTPSQQSRPATTYAAPPPAAAAPPPTASQGPGLFGQMASTAAGVAIGSSVGHAIGNMFTGGSSSPVEQTNAAPAQAQQSQHTANCDGALKSFTTCLDEHQGNMQICNWYLEQLKACQAASSQ